MSSPWAPAGLRPVSDHTLCLMFVCVRKVRGKREPRRVGAGTLRKPTASFMTARGASGVSYIKKRSVAEKTT